MPLLDDAVILAGATGRVGGVTLREFAAQGARLLVLSRSEDHAQAAIDRWVIAEHRERAIPFGADLNDPDSAAAAVNKAVRLFGRLDAVVSLVGRGHFVRLIDSTEDDAHDNLQSNFVANYNLLMPALRAMIAQKMGGRLVAVSAGSSKDPQPRFGLFGASKAALNVLMQSIAREHKNDGIVSNVVVLGSVATEAAKNYLSEEEYAAASTPAEVASVLAFLAGSSASGINGALVDVNAREVD